MRWWFIPVIGAACVAMVDACVGDDPAAVTTPNDAGNGLDATTADATTDATTSDASASDGNADAADAARCSLDKMFGTAAAVPGINGPANDLYASLTDDELEIVFASDRGDAGTKRDFYRATRATKADAFGTPAAVTELNTVEDEGRISITPDGLKVIFDRSVPGGKRHILRGERANRGLPFSGLTDMTPDGGDDYEPNLKELADAFVFVSRRGASQTPDIYRQFYPLTTTTGSVGEVSTATVFEGNPVLSRDLLSLYFATAATDGGKTSIVHARRPAGGVAFGAVAPQPVTELTTANDDAPSWLSPDGCTLYFQTNTGGNYDLYFATRGK